jgi:hypothetical protein
MKLYQNFKSAAKVGATEAVTLDGQPKFAFPGLRPQPQQVARFKMALGGQPVEGHDRVFSFGPCDDIWCLRVEGVAGGHTIELFSSQTAGQEAYAAAVARYNASKKWSAMEGT